MKYINEFNLAALLPHSIVKTSSTHADDTESIGRRSDRTEHYVGMYIGGISQID